MSAATPESFRDVMSVFATGVTVMTTRSEEMAHGMTASAVASASLEPLLVLVCVERTTVMADAVVAVGSFALSLLSGDQQRLSEHFADSRLAASPAQFDDIDHHGLTTGAPVLDGAVSAVDCRLWATHDGGDHIIVVGEVIDLETPPARPQPLVYFRSGYTRLDDQYAGRSG